MLSNVNPWILMFALSSTVAAFSQMLLKKSANETHKNFIQEYLNWKVIVGYGMMFVGMICTVIGYSHNVEVKSGSMMETLGNVWVVVLSFLFFREPLTKKKIFGNILIIAGIIIFNLA
ncbi:MAG: EamA family transporter [Lachnospiraceae bacterium]|nr:EamA family transporter [Lachnospiraceae bacterium]